MFIHGFGVFWQSTYWYWQFNNRILILKLFIETFAHQTGAIK